jgi:hypothetical protein
VSGEWARDDRGIKQGWIILPLFDARSSTGGRCDVPGTENGTDWI